MAKDSFILYKSQYEIISTLPKEIQVELYDSIMKFAFFRKKPENQDVMFLALFKVFEDQITRDQLKFDETCMERAINGRKGGLAKASNTKQKLATLSNTKQGLANLADNDTVNDTDTVNENDFKKEEKEKVSEIPFYKKDLLNRLSNFKEGVAEYNPEHDFKNPLKRPGPEPTFEDHLRMIREGEQRKKEQRDARNRGEAQ